jgi:uncharacterized protein YjbI with pentapeptide repeats
MVTPIGDVAATTLLWTQAGQLSATVVVKARFQMTPKGRAALSAPPELLAADVHHGKNPVRSIVQASDLVPYRGRCDVWVMGHAHAPGGQPTTSMAARLALYQNGQAVIDKTVLVHGHRASATAAPAPFQRMELCFERAYGGRTLAENPVGVGAAGPGAFPNLQHPTDPRAVACFAPLPLAWRQRLHGVPEALREKMRKPPLQLADAQDWRFFQAAPPDQQAPFLRGDEWLVLDGMHPSLPRLQTQLPGARAEVRAWAASATPEDPGYPVQLNADTLAIDTDAQTCAVVWRGSFTLASLEAVSTLRLGAGLALPGQAIDWQAARKGWVAPVGSGTHDLAGSTANLAGAAPEAPTPFAIAPPGRGERLRPAPIPGAPWVEEPAPPSARPALHDSAPETTVPQLRTVVAPPQSFTPAMVSETTAVRMQAAAPPAASETTSARLRAATPPPDLKLTSKAAPPQEVAGTVDLETLFGRAEDSAPSDGALPFLARPRPAPKLPGMEAPLPFTAPAGDTQLPEDGERGDTVPTFCAAPLAVASFPWQIVPPQPALIVIVKASFDLVAGAAAEPRAEADVPTGDVHHGDDASASLRYPSDYAVRKPRADVIVNGTAHAPGGKASAMEAGFRFGEPGAGGFERRIAVLGDRVWGPISPSEPQPFERIPLRFERAFGGGGDARNPYGRGRGAGPDGRRALPNLERQRALIKSPSDAPEPACFGALPYVWRAGRARTGTYDAVWLARYWPYFPPDFDYAYFQQAPPEQQLARIAGDERWDAWGMRPEGAIGGELPGLRVQCFAVQTGAAGGGLAEIPLALDTCVFDLDAFTLHLVWRGALEVSDNRASELAALFATARPLDAAALDATEAAREYRALRTERDTDLDEVGLGPDDTLRRAAQQRADALRSALPFDAGVEAPPPPPSPEEAAERMREAGSDPVQIAAAVAALGEAGHKRMSREVLERFLAGGGDIAELDLEGAELDGVDLSGLALAGARLARVRLCGARLVGCDLRRANLAGADLEDAVLDEANLSGADLTGARLARASLRRAVLDEADLSGANGDAASFEGVAGTLCIFAEGSWGGARFGAAMLPGADFTDCSLAGAVFDGASLRDVRLFRARGERVSFRGADLSDARGDGASLPKSTFEGGRAPGSVWEKASLPGASFASAVLGDASFVRADLERAVLGRASLRGARLREARLGGAVLIKADLMQADLEGADLRGADLRGASLYGAELWKADLESARLDGADVHMTKLKLR